MDGEVTADWGYLLPSPGGDKHLREETSTSSSHGRATSGGVTFPAAVRWRGPVWWRSAREGRQTDAFQWRQGLEGDAWRRRGEPGGGVQRRRGKTMAAARTDSAPVSVDRGGRKEYSGWT